MGATGFSTWRFILGGDVLARAILEGNTAFVPTRRLAQAMAMMARHGVRPDTILPDMRVRLCLSALLMAQVLPETAADAEACVTEWRGPGIGCPSRMHDPEALLGRILLSLRANEVDDAVQALTHLADRFPEFPSVGAAYDLVVARVQDHGAEREASCLRNLAFAHREEPVLAALCRLLSRQPRRISRRRTTPHVPAFLDDRRELVGAV